MYHNHDHDHIIKILLAGERGTGKSCLLLRLTDNTYGEHFISTIGVDFKIKYFDVNNKRCKLQIHDHTREVYPESHSRKSRYNQCGAHGIILIYDVTDQKSLEQLQAHIAEIRREVSEKFQPFLVGTKNDLTNKIEVEESTAENFARQHNLIYLGTTSAKTSNNVENVFQLVNDHIYSRINPNYQPSNTPISRKPNKGARKEYDSDYNFEVQNPDPRPSVNHENHSFSLKTYIKIGLAISAAAIALIGLLLIALALAALTGGVGPVALATAAMLTAGFTVGAKLLAPAFLLLGAAATVGAAAVIAGLTIPKIIKTLSFFGKCGSRSEPTDSEADQLGHNGSGVWPQEVEEKMSLS